MLCVVPIGVLIGEALVLLSGYPFVLRVFLEGSALGIVAALIALYIGCRIFTVEVSPAGINSHTVWGRRRFIEWEKIDRVTAIRLLNLRYLRIFTRGVKSPAWLPLFFPNHSDFRRVVVKWSPRESPITAHI